MPEECDLRAAKDGRPPGRIARRGRIGAAARAVSAVALATSTALGLLALRFTDAAPPRLERHRDAPGRELLVETSASGSVRCLAATGAFAYDWRRRTVIAANGRRASIPESADLVLIGGREIVQVRALPTDASALARALTQESPEGADLLARLRKAPARRTLDHRTWERLESLWILTPPTAP